MYTDILHHIERLQIELGSIAPFDDSTKLTTAVAEIAARLRETATDGMFNAEAEAVSQVQYRPDFMQ